MKRTITTACATLVAIMASAAVLSDVAPGHVASMARTLGKDPFGWLIPANSPAARQWAARRTRRATEYLQGLPAFPAARRQIETAERAGTPLPQYFLLGRRIARLERNARHPYGILQMAVRRGRDGSAGPWKTVLDLDALNRREGTDYELMFFDMRAQCLPPGYARCLLPLARGGSSLIAYREFDDVTGQFVKGGFSTPPIRDDIAWLSGNEVVVGEALRGSPALASGFARIIRLWRRGTPLYSARPIFRAGAGDSFTSVTGLGAGRNRRVIITDGVDYAHFRLYTVDQRGLVEEVGLPQRLTGIGTPVGSNRDLIVQLAAGAAIEDRPYPPEALVAYDLDRRRVAEVYVPPAGAYVNDPFMGLAGTRSAVAFVQTLHLRKTLYFAQQTAGHWTVRRSISAAAGVAMHIVAANEEGGSVLVSEEGFLQPKRLLWARPGSAARVVQSQDPVIASSQYRVEIHTAVSKDGTPIDYYLVRPKILAKGPVPTIVTGYGAYGVNDDPNYFGDGLGRSLVPWLARGGAYVVAAIRGGGERGAPWHEAAMGLNKQRSFDDFIAVAQDLVRSGFTAPCALGNYGRSAGGLLVAAVDVERPRLFAASLIGVPIVDMLRLSGGAGISGGMSAEFGNPSTSRGFEALLAYSPYENIRNGVKYPRMLVVTATDDTQVGPGQARKFVAKLQAVGAHPLLIEGRSGGHGYPNEYEHPTAFATQITFFIHYLMTDGCRAHPAGAHGGGDRHAGRAGQKRTK